MADWCVCFCLILNSVIPCFLTFYEFFSFLHMFSRSLGCDLGKYGSSEGICSLCAAGTFQDIKGEPSCQKCPVDTYLSQEGKSSKADCKECSSEKSTGAATSNENASSCLCKRTLFYINTSDDTCNQCPTGADCSHKDGIHLNDIFYMIGLWCCIDSL